MLINIELSKVSNKKFQWLQLSGRGYVYGT